MTRFLARSGIFSLALVGAVFAAGLAWADPAGSVIGTVKSNLPVVLGTLAAAAALAALTFSARITERFAAPARAKPAEQRTILDDAAIQADGTVDALVADALRIERLTKFLADFALARLDVVLDPLLSQAEKAEKVLDDSIAEWTERNPDVAAAINIDTENMKRRLTAAVGKVMVNAAGAAAGQIAKVAE